LPAGTLESEAEIAARHASETTTFVLEMMEAGIVRLSDDSRFWAFGERLKREWTEWRQRSEGGKLVSTTQMVEDENGEMVEMVVADRPGRFCTDCGVSLPAPTGRGRPPVRCQECKNAPSEPKAPRPPKADIPVKPRIERHCVDCDVTLPAPQGRGRPATRCQKCRGI
jgi:hypothetical protein